jgi:hypothetical protein
MKIYRQLLIMAVFILLLFSNAAAETNTSNGRISSIGKCKYDILIDISEFKLYLINRGTHEVSKIYPIAGGKPATPSPYGTWTIVYKASNWGAGFGSRWMRLNTPWGKYGIHGTNKPLTINNPDSLGCIRMFNSDIEELYKLVNCGTIVVIYGGPYGQLWSTFRTLAPGDRGADVVEIQRRLKDRGYYLGEIDGIYENELKSAIIKFKKDNKLKLTHFADKEFYNALGMVPFD